MSEKKEYIERGALVAFVREVRKNLPKDSKDFFTRDEMLLNFQQYLELQKAADVEPVVREHWKWFCEVDSTTNGYEEDYGWRCSGCRAKLTDYIADGDVYDEYPVRMKHCPNCGAHMERSGGA